MDTRGNSPNWDLLGGVLVAALGIGFLALGWHLRPGTLAEMGPGFAPRALSFGMIAIGAILALKAVGRKAQPASWPRLRPFVIVVACPVLFGLLIRPLGLVPTILIVASLARLAEPQKFGWDAVLMPVGLAIFCVVVFVEFIELPIKLWP